jgi:hypothetical protein
LDQVGSEGLQVFREIDPQDLLRQKRQILRSTLEVLERSFLGRVVCSLALEGADALGEEEGGVLVSFGEVHVRGIQGMPCSLSSWSLVSFSQWLMPYHS